MTEAYSIVNTFMSITKKTNKQNTSKLSNIDYDKLYNSRIRNDPNNPNIAYENLMSLFMSYVFKASKIDILKVIHKKELSEKITDKTTDKMIFTQLKKKYGVYKIKDQKKRAKARAMRKIKFIKDFFFDSNKFAVNKYLDIGTEDIIWITTFYNIFLKPKPMKKTVYGINVKSEFFDDKKLLSPYQRKKFNFTFYDGGNIPFDGFDFITITMVLHHVDKQDELIKNMFKLMISGGYVVVYEHLIRNKNDKYFVDFIHNLYMFQNDNKDDKPTEHKYIDPEELKVKFIKVGFKYEGVKYESQNKKYYMVFKHP